MTLEVKIKDVYVQARANKWKYPQLFAGLKAVGVKSYSVDVTKHTIEYREEGNSVVHSGPAGWNVKLGAFNQNEVINAVRRSQRGETDYLTFLKEIAAAGVPRYYVSMAESTVSYFGAKPGDQYVEKVPAV